MLQNADGNVLQISGFFINGVSLITVNVTVFPDLTSYQNGLSKFQKTIPASINLEASSTTSIKSTAADSSLSVYDNVISFIEDEVVAQSSKTPENFTLNGQVKGTWSKI